MNRYTETTRDRDIDRMLQEMEERGESLPSSRSAEELERDQPQG